MQGRSFEEYAAPLFLAWQLTNRCSARCIACCEESGPDKAWADELTRAEALDLAGRIAESGIPYVAFGGGEPLSVAHCWEIFERLAAAGVSLKIETDGSRIDDAAADRIASLAVQCVQISVDGATAATHERVRPGSSFAAAIAAIERLAARGQPPQFVFVPTRYNLHEIVAAFDLAASLGCNAFVTGPMMRIGRAAAAWSDIAVSDSEWQRAADDASRACPVARPPDRSVDLSLGHRDGDGDASRKPAGDAARGAQRQGQALERASVLARGFAARLARDGMARLSRRVAQRRRAGVRRPLPVGARAAASRQRDVAHAIARRIDDSQAVRINVNIERP